MRERGGRGTTPLPTRSTAAGGTPRFHSTAMVMTTTTPPTRTTRTTTRTRHRTCTGMSTASTQARPTGRTIRKMHRMTITRTSIADTPCPSQCRTEWSTPFPLPRKGERHTTSTPYESPSRTRKENREEEGSMVSSHTNSTLRLPKRTTVGVAKTTGTTRFHNTFRFLLPPPPPR